jgi:tyrosinase
VNIYIFLGEEEPGKDVLGWIKEDGFVGVAGMLSAAEGMRMGDHGTAGESHAEVPLTAALEAKVRVGELAGLQEGIVAEYLRRNLKWRVGRVSLTTFLCLFFSPFPISYQTCFING